MRAPQRRLARAGGVVAAAAVVEELQLDELAARVAALDEVVGEDLQRADVVGVGVGAVEEEQRLGVGERGQVGVDGGEERARLVVELARRARGEGVADEIAAGDARALHRDGAEAIGEVGVPVPFGEREERLLGGAVEAALLQLGDGPGADARVGVEALELAGDVEEVLHPAHDGRGHEARDVAGVLARELLRAEQRGDLADPIEARGEVGVAVRTPRGEQGRRRGDQIHGPPSIRENRGNPMVCMVRSPAEEKETGMRSVVVGAVVVLGLLVVNSASQAGGSGATLDEPQATTLPPIKVDLPPAPSWAASDIPEKHPDGVYTIRGVRKQRATTLGKDVKVRAYLLEVYQCPVCPKGQTCKLCEQPHFFLGDKPDTKKEKALMVVDYLLPKQKPPVLTVGKQYDIDGTFNINSPTGFGSSDGLLVFGKMKDDKGTEFLSTALQLESKAKAGEAIEAALAAKRAAAQKNKK